MIPSTGLSLDLRNGLQRAELFNHLQNIVECERIEREEIELDENLILPRLELDAILRLIMEENDFRSELIDDYVEEIMIISEQKENETSWRNSFHTVVNGVICCICYIDQTVFVQCEYCHSVDICAECYARIKTMEGKYSCPLCRQPESDNKRYFIDSNDDDLKFDYRYPRWVARLVILASNPTRVDENGLIDNYWS